MKSSTESDSVFVDTWDWLVLGERQGSEPSLGSLVIERIDPDRFDKAWKLRLRYKDKPRVSFNDLTMRENHIRRVLTADAHFDQIGLGFQTIP